MKKYVLSLFFAFMLLPLAACPGPGMKVKLGQEFSLAIGQSAAISSEKMKIEFVAVTADSRCPSGAECIWAGEARCTIMISLKENEQTVTLVQPGGGSSVATKIEGYSLNFILTPYPQLGQQIKDRDYRLVLTINKS